MCAASSKTASPVSYTHLDVYKRQVQEEPLQALLTAYPNMGWFVENVVLVPGYSFAREFAPGLELLLDGIESRRRGVPASGCLLYTSRCV